jgi:hypothetical protein
MFISCVLHVHEFDPSLFKLFNNRPVSREYRHDFLYLDFFILLLLNILWNNHKKGVGLLIYYKKTIFMSNLDNYFIIAQWTQVIGIFPVASLDKFW